MMVFCPDCPNPNRCNVSNDCMGADPSDARRGSTAPADPSLNCPGCGRTPQQTCANISTDCRDRAAFGRRPPPAPVEYVQSNGAPAVSAAFGMARDAVTAEQTHFRDMLANYKPPALSGDSAARKATPICSGVLDYFPLALAAVARLSKIGNDKHNPGEPLNWSRGKSTDHADCILRHMIDRGTIDPDSGELHEVGVAWRALAQLQIAEEKRLAGGKG